MPTCDAAAALTGLYDLIPIKGVLTVSVAGCDESEVAIVVTIRYLRP